VQLFADHINNLAAQLEKHGRRAVMWGDALLESGQWPPGFAANGSSAVPTHGTCRRTLRPCPPARSGRSSWQRTAGLSAGLQRTGEDSSDDRFAAAAAE
jgi:hypothetical protein